MKRTTPQASLLREHRPSGRRKPFLGSWLADVALMPRRAAKAFPLALYRLCLLHRQSGGPLTQDDVGGGPGACTSSSGAAATLRVGGRRGNSQGRWQAEAENQRVNANDIASSGDIIGAQNSFQPSSFCLLSSDFSFSLPAVCSSGRTCFLFRLDQQCLVVCDGVAFGVSLSVRLAWR